MTIRIDRDHKKLYLSVGDLLSADIIYRIGFSGSASMKRMWVGQGIHTLYLRSRQEADPEYRVEVPVSHQFSLDAWEIKVMGRLDGLYRSGDQAVVIEEIKSIYFDRDLDRFKRGSMGEWYRRQAALYAWLWESQTQDRVNCSVILIDVTGRGIETVPVEYDYDTVDGFVRGRIEAVLREDARSERERERKKLLAKDLPFPYEMYRMHQETMIGQIETVLKQSGQLLVNAPTGIGKTAAALYPSVRHALENGLNVYYLTAKTLQQDMAVKTLKMMNRTGVFKSLRLRSKVRMCANQEIVCHEDFCVYARDYGEKVRSLGTAEKLFAAFHHLDPDDIYAAAVSDEVCPFEISLELSKMVDVVVCDYNYVFDPAVSLRETRDRMSLSDLILIIDEAHNLVDRGSAYYSPEISLEMIRHAREALSLLPSDLSDRLAHSLECLCSDIRDLIRSHLGDDPGESVIDPPDIDFARHLGAMETDLLDYLAFQHEQGKRRREDPVLNLYYLLTRFAYLQMDNGREFSWIVRKEQDSERIKLLCMDPSRFTGKILKQASAVIAMSATLTPFNFYETVLGFSPDNVSTLNLPSPFPEGNREIMVIKDIPTVYRRRIQSADQLVNLLHSLGHAVSGNFLVLLPSYSYLDLLLPRWPPGGKNLLVQNSAMTPEEREMIVNTLRNGNGDHILMAVSGGMYAEGVDYPGEVLRGVMIVSPSLPQVGLEQELLKSYYQERYESGFSFAYLIPGMRRVVQAAGRVIRSETDRGVIVLIGERFSDSRYTRYFPDYWYNQDVEELVKNDPVSVIKQFFGGHHET